MRILFSVPGYKPAWRLGGPVLSASLLAERLVALGHDVTVLSTNANLDQDLDVPLGRPISVQGVKVWYFDRHESVSARLPMIPYLSGSLGYLYSRSLKRTLQRLAPQVDLIHVHMPFNYPTLAAAKVAASVGKPLFYNQHGGFNPVSLEHRRLKKTLYLKLFEIPILNRATMLIALTEAERESYRRLTTSVPCRIVPNAVNTEEYGVPIDEPELAEFGIAADDLVVLFLGRISSHKGITQLLEAFLRIAPRHRHARLCIAGPDQESLEMLLRERAMQAGAADRVCFLGMLEGERKKRVLARADLFCLPSIGEGFSVAALEALASGTAVLLSPQCNFSKVASCEAGLIVDSSVECLEHGLNDLLSNPERMWAMGRHGRSLVQQHYSISRVTDQLVEVYQEGLLRFASSSLPMKPQLSVSS